MSRRRGRVLGEEEKALWSAVKKSVTPLRPEPEEPPPPPPALAAPAAPPPPPTQARHAMPAYVPPGPAARPDIPSLHPLGRRERHLVQRGKTEIDGRLDLHGYRQDEAHLRLTGFLGHAQASGWKLVLVITGKGRPGGDFQHLHEPERGVLRRVVPLWLSLPDMRRYVLGFEDAHLAHGGSGALYIRIRRRK